MLYIFTNNWEYQGVSILRFYLTVFLPPCFTQTRNIKFLACHFFLYFFNFPYSLNVLTFQNAILVFHFIPKWSPHISGRLLFISFSLIIVFKLWRLLAYSTRSQWWGCHLSLWAGWFSAGLSSPNIWSSPFSTRQFWSTLFILLPSTHHIWWAFPYPPTGEALDGRPANPYET